MNQVVNDNHSLSSRLSILFNLWISVRNQWIYDFHIFITSLCICRTFCFLRFNWVIVSRYENNWGAVYFRLFPGWLIFKSPVIRRSRVLHCGLAVWKLHWFSMKRFAVSSWKYSIFFLSICQANRGRRERHSQLATYSQYSFACLSI